MGGAPSFIDKEIETEGVLASQWKRLDQDPLLAVPSFY